jgi:hypothetical protein
MMEEPRFKALAEAYGGDVLRWPEADQASARAFQAAHPERAEAVLSEAQALDELLVAAGPVEPAQALEAAILARMAQFSADAAPAPRWAGLAAGLALTFGLGAGWFAASEQNPFADLAFAEAFGALESEDVLEALAREEAQ